MIGLVFTLACIAAAAPAADAHRLRTSRHHQSNHAHRYHHAHRHHGTHVRRRHHDAKRHGMRVRHGAHSSRIRDVSQIPRHYRVASLMDGRRQAGNVVAEAEKWIGHRNMTGTRGPWCADFTQFVLKRTGHSSVRSRMARDAVHAGRPIRGPVVGAIMSLPHHAGFVVGVLGKGRVLLVSGNHGHRVGVGIYSTRHAHFAAPA